MTDPVDQELIRGVEAARARFLDRVAELRPALHRYCARMVGSVVDGEDVVQEALARAFFALPQLDRPPELRPWLFRIAHNAAIDRLRASARTRSYDEDTTGADPGESPEDAAVRAETARLAIGRFLELPPAQRSCVVLKDVLGHSLAEIADTLDLSIPAVKAALHRGRVALRDSPAPAEVPPGAPSDALVRYVALFNARDWDAIRAQLAEDVRLDVVARASLSGRTEVGEYFSRYEAASDWHFAPGWLEGREVAVVTRPDGSRYFVHIGFVGGAIIEIRDWRHVSYIADEVGP